MRWDGLIMLLALAARLGAQETGATLSGMVEDAETGHAVAAALVLLVGTQLRSVTLETGGYVIAGIPPGRYTVRVTHIGYQAAVRELTLDPGAQRTLDVALNPTVIDLADVVVTASRSEERPGDSPASVAVLTRDAALERGAITIDQALPFVPGVIFNNGQIDIRGASGNSGGVGSRVLILLDGHPILTGDGGEVDFNAVPLLDLDRAEIVKGAYSALYGSNALGGVVNMITTPIGRVPETVVAAHYGVYDTPAAVRFTTQGLATEDIDLQHSRRVGDVGTRLAVRREHSDGFEQDAWVDRWMVRTKLTWPGDDPHAATAYAMVTSEDDGNHFIWRSAAEPYAVDSASAGDWSRAQKLLLGATLSPVTTAAALLQVSPYVFYNTLQNHFHDNQDYHRATRIGTDLQLALNPWPTQALTVGGNLARTWVVSNFLGHPTLDDAAVYAQDELAVAERLRASLGARLDYHDAASGATEYAFSPKLGVVFKVSPVLSTRASLGHGYRAPSAIEQFVSATMAGFRVIPNPDLRGETAWSSELGATATIGGWLWLDGAVFQSDYEDLIGPAPGPPPGLAFQFQNVQRARVRGLDLGGKAGFWGSRLALEAAYTYLDAQDRATGDALPYRSRHNLAGTLTALGGLASLDVRYRSRVATVLAYPLDPRGAITIVDLRLGYRVLGSVVQAKVSNLLQAAYVDVMERNRGAPRSLLLSVYRTM